MVKYVDPKSIQLNIDNPRKKLEAKDIEESMKSEGFKINFPVTVRPIKHEKFKYRVIHGDRRTNSAIRVGIPEIPVIIEDIDDKHAYIETIKENVLRENFTPVEEANAFLKLKADYSMTNVDIARMVCKTEGFVRNRLDLLNLDPAVVAIMEKEKISLRKAEYISQIADKSLQKELISKAPFIEIDEMKQIVDKVKKAGDRGGKVLDRLSLIEKKFKSSPLYKEKVTREKDEKKEIASISNEFFDVVNDMASWENMFIASAAEAESKFKDVEQLYNINKDKQKLKGYIKDVVKNKKRIESFYKSKLYLQMEELL